MSVLPDEPDGYLFLVVDEEFYALTKPQLVKAATKISQEEASDIRDVLEALVGTGFVLADIQGPGETEGGRPDSCACIALNIDAFDDRIQEKQRNIVARMQDGKKKPTKTAALKAKPGKPTPLGPKKKAKKK